MEILIPTAIAFFAAVLIMSVGVFMKRKPLQGSCGGIANFSGDCDFCELKDQCVEHGTPQCDDHKLVDQCKPIS